MTTKEQEVYQAAERLYQANLDWASFFRETLGATGVARAVFKELDEWVAFQQTYEYSAIQLMIAKLRERGAQTPDEPTKVITIRLPQSLQEALRVEAESMQTSVNKLCISKLMQIIDNSLVPNESAAKAAREAERDREPVPTE
jgi:predicted HicB family RNase H-like nuclease